jgi:hypothetical protein
MQPIAKNFLYVVSGIREATVKSRHGMSGQGAVRLQAGNCQ